MPQMVVGVAWYSQDQWDKIRAASEDKDDLEVEYSKWLANAEKMIEKMARAGIPLHKTHIDYDELMVWAGEKNLPINASTRAGYCQYLVALHAERAREVGRLLDDPEFE